MRVRLPTEASDDGYTSRMPTERRSRYQEIRAKGLCGSCASNKAEAGFARCRPCMDQTKETRAALIRGGLCVSCKKPTTCLRTTCDDCADFERKRNGLNRKDRRAAGLCSECGGKPRKGKSLCGKCAKLLSARAEEHRQRCKELGICKSCGKESLSGMTFCAECREKRLAYSRSYDKNSRDPRRVSADNKKRRDDRRAAGLCPKCGKEPPAPGRKNCDDCLKANTISCQLRRIKKKQQGPVAQKIEQSPPKAKVAGATPAGIIAREEPNSTTTTASHETCSRGAPL